MKINVKKHVVVLVEKAQKSLIKAENPHTVPDALGKELIAAGLAEAVESKPVEATAKDK